MTQFDLGALRLVLSWEQADPEDPDCKEEEDEETNVFLHPLSLTSPSSEQRKAYIRNCKRRKRLGSAMDSLAIQRNRQRGDYSALTSGGLMYAPINSYQTPFP